MAEVPVAREITLRKFNPRAPLFHRHIVRSKLVGQVCRKGDRFVVYEVAATDPEGTVTVTQGTVFRFE
jgi:hypothetical protein